MSKFFSCGVLFLYAIFLSVPAVANLNEERPISEVIRERIDAAEKPYLANDNIAEFIKPGELDALIIEVEGKIKAVLDSLIIDTEHDHNTADTAKRVAKMYITEIFSGRYRAMPDMTAFPNINYGYKNALVIGPIKLESTCAHHFQNIRGQCFIGIIPAKEFPGLSKFSKVVRFFSERPQIQEELTPQIAHALQAYAGTEDVAVLILAEHQCMSARGVREHETLTTTVSMSGQFETNPERKNEFYSFVDMALAKKK